MNESIYKNKRGPFPAPGITWGEKGLKAATYLGKLPFSATGKVTKNCYKWSEKKPERQVDVRDLESIVELGGGSKRFEIEGDEEQQPPDKQKEPPDKQKEPPDKQKEPPDKQKAKPVKGKGELNVTK